MTPNYGEALKSLAEYYEANQFSKNEPLSRALREAGTYSAETLDEVNQHSYDSAAEAVIFNISDETNAILKNTKNEILPRNLPFVSLYISCKFTCRGYEINGIFVHGKGSKFIQGTDDDGTEFIFCDGYAKSSTGYKFIGGVITNNDDFKEKARKAFPEVIESSIEEYVCNFLDLLNNPEVQIIESDVNKERNTKRAVRGLLPIPEYRTVNVTGQLKVFARELLEGQGHHFSHKFSVRGHFARLWNKARFSRIYDAYSKGQNNYYFDKKNDVLMMWRAPSFKGKGLLVQKSYEVRVKK